MEHATHYRTQNYKGKPVFVENDVPVVLPSYCACAPGWKDAWTAAHKRYIDHGRKIFWLMPTGGYNGEWGTTPFWTEPGRINYPPAEMPDDYMGLDQQAEIILNMCPEARFFVRMTDLPPETWKTTYPDDMLLNYEGHLYPVASYASDRYIEELGGYLKALTRYCEHASWAERVIGYVIYPLGEGSTPLACEGFLFDQSKVMQTRFREFVRKKYQDDQALQHAWQDETVTLENATVPGDDDFRKRNSKVLYWPNARQVQRERDYFECQVPLFRRYCDAMLNAFRAEAGGDRLCGFDAFKGNMLGWMTHAIFRGNAWRPHYGDQFLATGTTGMAEMLKRKGLSIVATPHDYRNRWVGFGYDPEGIGDSVHLHERIMFIEEDQRSYTNNERGLFGSIEPGEEESVLYRNLAATISKGHQTYPMDVCVGYFNSDEIQSCLENRLRIQQEFLDLDRQDVPGVVMLVDDRSGYYTDFSAEFNDLAVIRQRIYGMNHCGVPTRTFLWDDLERDNFPLQHKLYLLPNCYKSDQQTLDILHEKLFRNGNVIVFGPGSGITDGETVSAKFATQLLGIDFELYDYEYPRFVTIDNWDHPVTRYFGACDVFGDTHRYGPVLVPFDRNAPECKGGIASEKSLADGDGTFTGLGTIALDNGKRRPGLVVKEFDDYTIVFTTALPLPAKMLRELARISGTHIYNKEDDVVYADTTMVTVHAVRPGPRTIRLPGIFSVHDVISDQPVGENLSEITFEVEKPVTVWYRLKQRT